MSDNNTPNNTAPQMGEAVQSTAEAVNTAAKQAKPVDSGELPQEVLEKMSGEELKEYFAKQKAREANKAQPRQPDGKFTSKEPANPIKEAAQEATEAVRKYKVKVDGVDQEVDEAELLRGYSHQKAANKKLQEGLAARKQAEQFLSMMKDKSTLFDTIQKLGHDPRALAEEYLAQLLQDEMMDPREKELRDARKKLQSFEDIERKQKEEIARRHHEEMKKKYAAEYNLQFTKALQETGLPATKPMVAEMAKYISRAAKTGYEITPSEAAKLVLEDVKQAQMRLIGDSDAETLLKLLGDDVANKIRQADVARLKTPQQVVRQIPKEEQATEHRERSSSKKRMTPQEWRNYNRKK